MSGNTKLVILGRLASDLMQIKVLTIKHLININEYFMKISYVLL